MPELDGTSIAALASFVVLVIAWIAAPNETKTATLVRKPAAEAA